MADTKVEYLIEILKRGTGAKDAVSDFENVEKASKKAGNSLEDFGKNAKAAFAALGGVALMREALAEFTEAEKSVARLNGALRSTGQFTPELSAKLQELADHLQDITNIPDDQILNVMAKLTALGAKDADLRRLTMAVLDLSVLMDKDMNRATMAMARALQGDAKAFSDLGIQVDESKSAIDQFNDALRQVEKLAGGQAKEAAASLAGEIDSVKNAVSDLKEGFGKMLAISINGLGKLIEKAGELVLSFGNDESAQRLAKQHDNMRASLERSIDSFERLKKVSKEAAEAMRLNLAVSFGENPFPGEDGAFKQPRARNMHDEQRALREVRVTLYPESAGWDDPPKDDPAAARATQRMKELEAAKYRAAQDDYLSGVYGDDLKAQEDAQNLAMARTEAAERAAADYMEEQQREAKQMEQQLERELEERNRVAMERQRQAQEVANYERSLEDQTRLVGLEGRQLETEQLSQAHEERVRQIQQLKFEDEDRYMQLMELEGKLYKTEQQRVDYSHSANARLQRDIKQIGATAVEAFSQGMARALIDSFTEGDKAFQRFAANFLRMIAEMILQSLILYAVQSMLRAAGFSFMGGGGQVGAGAGGPAKAAAGIQRVRMAADGLQATEVPGVKAVDKPTLFPGFNVVAGEAGMEMLTVLANPRTTRFGGITAQVGWAGDRRLAIVDANSLLNFAAPRPMAQGGMTGTGVANFGGGSGGGGGGGGGLVEVLLRLEPGLRAEIIRQSVQSAKVEVLNDMTRDTPISQAAMRLTR